MSTATKQATSTAVPATDGGSVPTPSVERAKAVRKLWAELVKIEAQAQEVRDEITKLLAGEQTAGQQQQAVTSHFEAQWKRRYRTDYLWRHVQDMPHVKRLVRQLGVEEVNRRITRYLLADDEFYRKARHGWGMFVATINTHVGQDEAPAESFELTGTVEGCTHTPPCRHAAEHTQRYMREVLHGGK